MKHAEKKLKKLLTGPINHTEDLVSQPLVEVWGLKTIGIENS